MMSAPELCTIIISVFLIIVGSIHTFFAWNYDYWKKRNVPHDPARPIVGSLGYLMSKSPADWFIEKYQRFHNSDYFGIWIFRKPALVICSPELARRVLVKDFVYFRNRFLSSGDSDPLGGLNIFTVNDPLWSTVRRKLTPVSTSSKLRGMLSMKNFYARELVDRIRRDHVQQKKPSDVRNMLACLTTDVIGAAAFGMQENSVRSNESALRRVTREISTFTLRRGIEFSSIFFLPNIVDFFGFKFFTNDMSEFFKRIFWKMVDERSRDTSVRSKDLLDYLIDIRKEAQREGDTGITDDVIVAQAAAFMQGGFDTSAVLMSFLLLELSHHLDYQERLYEELKNSNALVDGTFDYTIVKELPYLDMCIKEALRKYPAMGWLDRIADMDYQVDDNLILKKGTPIYINAIGMHYDEKFFPEPRKFDPERFSKENEKNIVPFSFMPFGEGPRNCIGSRFALQSIKTVIAHLVINFEMRLQPGQRNPDQIKFDKNSMFLAPDSVIDLQFMDRNNK